MVSKKRNQGRRGNLEPFIQPGIYIYIYIYSSIAIILLSQKLGGRFLPTIFSFLDLFSPRQGESKRRIDTSSMQGRASFTLSVKHVKIPISSHFDTATPRLLLTLKLGFFALQSIDTHLQSRQLYTSIAFTKLRCLPANVDSMRISCL